MIEGILFIEKDGGIVLHEHNTPNRLVTIEPGSSLEIKLGNVWIEGKFRPDFTNNDEMVEPYDLTCEPGMSFCGLRSGMRARLPDVK